MVIQNITDASLYHSPEPVCVGSFGSNGPVTATLHGPLLLKGNPVLQFKSSYQHNSPEWPNGSQQEINSKGGTERNH